MRQSPVFAAVLVCTSIALSWLTASAQISVIGHLTDDRFVEPGTQYDGSIRVRNDTDVPQEVKIYQRDYFFAFDGTTVYGDPGRDARSNADWISYTPSLLRLEPHATGVVNYAVAVPDSTASEPVRGSYWSLMMVEAISPGSPESSQPRPAALPAMGISQQIRYGLQIATHITGTGTKDVRFLDVRMQTNEEGSTQLIVDVQNTGETWFRPAFSAEVFDAKGDARGTFRGQFFRMYPRTSVRHRIDLGDLPRGEYTVVLIVDAGGEDVFGAEYTLTL